VSGRDSPLVALAEPAKENSMIDAIL